MVLICSPVALLPAPLLQGRTAQARPHRNLCLGLGLLNSELCFGVLCSFRTTQATGEATEIRYYNNKRYKHCTIVFATRVLPCFTYWHNLFYVDKKKIIPLDLYNLLDYEALAY
jgi:hypothetical protein